MPVEWTFISGPDPRLNRTSHTNAVPRCQWNGHSLAAQIHDLTGHHTQMRYPDASGTDIPADRYTTDQANVIVQIALSLLQKVQDTYLQ